MPLTGDLSAYYERMMRLRQRPGEIIHIPNVQYYDEITSMTWVDVDSEKSMKKRFKEISIPINSTCDRLDTWVFYNKESKLIKDMSIKELQEAISNLKIGYKCYGQKNKIVTLQRILKEKKHV